jgi:hypothetical protein
MRSLTTTLRRTSCGLQNYVVSKPESAAFWGKLHWAYPLICIMMQVRHGRFSAFLGFGNRAALRCRRPIMVQGQQTTADYQLREMYALPFRSRSYSFSYSPSAVLLRGGLLLRAGWCRG